MNFSFNDFKFENLWLDQLEVDLEKNTEWGGNLEQIYTIFQVLSGVEEDYEGDIYWAQHSLNHLTMDQRKAFRQEIGFVFNWGGLLNNQSIIDNILLPMQYHNRYTEEKSNKIHSIFTEAGYSKYLDQRPYHVPMHVRKFSSIIRGLFSGVKCLFIEDFSMSLRPNDIDILKRCIEEMDVVIHYYDGLAKFSLEDADNVLIDAADLEIVA